MLGGVALFLFGMYLMGDGLKKVAGNKLELVLYKLTSTPLKGVLLLPSSLFVSDLLPVPMDRFRVGVGRRNIDAGLEAWRAFLA